MKSKDIFVLNANNGILLVNSKNAEMLSVKTEYINDVIKNIEEKNNNESLKNFIEAKIEDGNGIGIIPTLGCNFSCTYCFQKKLKKVDILPDMIPNIKKFIYEWNEKMHESKRRTNIKNSYEKIVSGIIFLIENNIEINLAVVFNPEFEIKEYILFMDWLESIGWLHNKNITVTIGLIKERDA